MKKIDNKILKQIYNTSMSNFDHYIKIMKEEAKQPTITKEAKPYVDRLISDYSNNNINIIKSVYICYEPRGWCSSTRGETLPLHDIPSKDRLLITFNKQSKYYLGVEFDLSDIIHHIYHIYNYQYISLNIYHTNTFNYTTMKLNSNTEMFFEINSKDIGTEISWSLEIHFPSKLLNRRTEAIVKGTIDVPIIQTKNDANECVICYDKISDDDKFITPCHHIFHQSCLRDYLSTNDKLYKNNCQSSFCEHGDVVNIDGFNCPICRSIVH